MSIAYDFKRQVTLVTGAASGMGLATASTVEVSVYCHPDARGRGCGTALYTALFTALEREDVHTIVAAVSLPNEASISLHERFGCRPVSVFHAVAGSSI